MGTRSYYTCIFPTRGPLVGESRWVTLSTVAAGPGERSPWPRVLIALREAKCHSSEQVQRCHTRKQWRKRGIAVTTPSANCGNNHARQVCYSVPDAHHQPKVLASNVQVCTTTPLTINQQQARMRWQWL